MFGDGGTDGDGRVVVSLALDNWPANALGEIERAMVRFGSEHTFGGSDRCP